MRRLTNTEISNIIDCVNAIEFPIVSEDGYDTASFHTAPTTRGNALVLTEDGDYYADLRAALREQDSPDHFVYMKRGAQSWVKNIRISHGGHDLIVKWWRNAPSTIIRAVDALLEENFGDEYDVMHAFSCRNKPTAKRH